MYISVYKYVYTYSYWFLVCFTKHALLKPMERTAPNHVLVVWAPATVTSSWAVYANQDGQGSGVIRTLMSVRRCRLKRNAWLKMLGVLILKGDTTVDVHRVSPKASAVFAKVGFCCVLMLTGTSTANLHHSTLTLVDPCCFPWEESYWDNLVKLMKSLV